MSDLAKILAEMRRVISELHRRQGNMIRAGRVVEVDPAAGTVRIDIGADGEELITPPIRWPERAGDRRSWNPPTVGEDMTVLSPTGEIGVGSFATYGGFTSGTPAPSNRGDAAVFAFGSVTITVEGALVRVQAPHVVIDADTVDLGGEGGQPVARIGDEVEVTSGSSAGRWKIVTGSNVVNATG